MNDTFNDAETTKSTNAMSSLSKSTVVNWKAYTMKNLSRYLNWCQRPS